jgi:urea transport system permease protein
MSLFFESIFNGISIGSVLLISALGLAIVFGLMGVINLAHGELMMLGAYTTFLVQNLFQSFGDPWFNLYFIVAIPCAFIVSGITGFLLEREVIRYLYGRPLETLLATWGVSLILIQFVRSLNWALMIGVIIFFLRNVIVKIFQLIYEKKLGKIEPKVNNLIKKLTLPIASLLTLGIIALLNYTKQPFLTKVWFGAVNLNVTAPVWLRSPVKVPGLEFNISSSRIFIVILTIICIAVIYWFLNYSNWGLRIRAVTQNRTMSACLGIPTRQVDAITFAIGSGLAGIAGCAITLLGSVGPNTGQIYIVDAFMVVVVGGVGNLFGTVVAALGIGTIDYLLGSSTIVAILTPLEFLKPLTDFFTFFSTTTMAKVMVFGLIIAFLQIKPAGLFPQKGRTAEL